MQANVKGPAAASYVSRRTTKGPGFYITFLILFIAILVSIGLFVYIKIIEGSIDEKLAQIKRYEAAFEPSAMNELIRADTRLTQANTLVENHVTVSEYLTLLEQVTLRSIRYETLSFSTGNVMVQTGQGASTQTPTAPAVILSGQARDFKQIALQADEYGKNADIRNPVVSNLNIDANDLAVFSVTKNIDQRLVSYTESIRSGRRVISDNTARTRATPTPVPTSDEVTATTTAATSTTIE